MQNLELLEDVKEHLEEVQKDLDKLMKRNNKLMRYSANFNEALPYLKNHFEINSIKTMNKTRIDSIGTRLSH